MSLEFKVKNRVEGSVNKIYFTCHPEDFRPYFNELATEILNIQECSIYYLDETVNYPEDIEDYKAQLSQFNLFVIPITSKFLLEPNRSREIDFKYAIDNKYPVLPILVEPDLYDAFNSVCSIQAIDKTSNDITKEPYLQQLDRYLKSVLIDKETVKRIKQAFDAYVFLSYRKKDRKYAQEIMSLIHSYDFMRDIAIWYDEFLTPGENFNYEIAENLLKSKLVTLVVTPNINERYKDKGNYVIEEEYPMAIKENKPVLPIESTLTNRSELNKNFPNIGEPVSISENNRISEYFKTIFKEAINLKNDNDPEHLFFIGLAYLNGIDVETNKDRAIELLKKSASSNYLPAYDVLANYYRNCEYKYATSNKWLEKAFAYCNNEYGFEHDNTKAYFNKLTKSLYETRCDTYYIEFMSKIVRDSIDNYNFEISVKYIEDIEATSEISRYGYYHRIFEMYVYMYWKLIENNIDDIDLEKHILNKLISISNDIENTAIKDSIEKQIRKTHGQNNDESMFGTIIRLCKLLNSENNDVIYKKAVHYNEINNLFEVIELELKSNFIDDVSENTNILELKEIVSDALMLASEDMESYKKLEFLEYAFIFNKLIFAENNYDVLAEEYRNQENDTFIELATYIFIQESSKSQLLPPIFDEISTYFSMHFYPGDFDTYIRDYLTGYFKQDVLFSERK